MKTFLVYATEDSTLIGKFIDRDDTLRFYAELDNECRAKLVERADAYYGNK